MKLNSQNWKGFQIDKLFILENGKANQGMLEEGNECFYVGAKRDDNGVMIHCAKDKSLIQKGNCIIFICNGQGSVGYANYMDVDFIGTTDIVAGYNENLNCYNGLFIATILCQERPKYSFGRKWKTHLRETIIDLPIQYNSNGTPYFDNTLKYSADGYVPDWKWMESYIKSLNHKPLTTKNKNSHGMMINIDEWEEFRFGNLISSIYKSKAINKDDLTQANDSCNSIRYITRTGDNNGCELLADLSTIPKEYIQEKNAITIGDTTATSFYQDEDFITGDHMVVVRSEWLTRPLGLYIITLLNKEQYKYSYGRAFLMDRIKDTVIRLPIIRKPDGTPLIDDTKSYSEKGYQPDWAWMQNYIERLPYGDRLLD